MVDFDNLRDEAEERALVVRVAQSWIGTPYHHMARLKGVGCDCLTLIACVFEEAGLVPTIEIPTYSPQFYLHRSEELYLEGVLKHAHQVDVPKEGDVVLFKMARAFGHGGIVIGWPRIIHAYTTAPVGTTDASIDAALLGREKRFFSIWGS